MAIAARHLARFIRRVYLRLLIVRALERVGVCVLIAAGAAVLVVGAMMWLGKDASRLAPGMLGIGAAAGMTWGIIRRPTPLEAALEADRQLALADLLSSAVLLRGDHNLVEPHVRMRRRATLGAMPWDDSWRVSVLAMADARCRELSARQVVLNRWGARAWGGIGLSAAFVVTLGSMSAVPVSSQAKPEQVDSVMLKSQPGDIDRGADRSVLRESARGRATASEPGSVSSDNHRGKGETGLVPTREGSDDRREGSVASKSSGGAVSAAAASSRGLGSVPTVSAPAVLTEPNPSRPSDPSASSGGSGAVPVAVRTATDASRSTAGEGAAGALAGSTTGPAVPPWRAEKWPAARSAADQAVRVGQVPDSYRGVLREYFDLE